MTRFGRGDAVWTQPPRPAVDSVGMLSTCPVRVALWLCALTGAELTPELVNAAASLLDASWSKRPN